MVAFLRSPICFMAASVSTGALSLVGAGLLDGRAATVRHRADQMACVLPRKRFVIGIRGGRFSDFAKRIGGDRASACDRMVGVPGGVLDGGVEASYPVDVINACFRSAYRLAYPLARRWWARRGHNGTAIAVWVGDRVLVVRHSYKPGLRLPGGGVKAGEDHMLAAIRELQEETGLIVAAADMVLLMETYGKFGKRSIFEVQLDAEPELTVDQREIVYAGFASVDSVIEYNPRLRSYLRARSSPPLAA